MGNRKDAENIILNYIDKMVPGGENKQLYVDMFSKMDNKAFDAFMLALKERKVKLQVIVPNGSSIKVDVNRNIKIAKELGHEFIQQLDVASDGDTPAYRTPVKYLVYKLPVRRASQLLSKKISIPTDSNHIDSLTGQVANTSASSKITYPEIQVLAGSKLNRTLLEFMKYRGGDIGAQNALDNILYKQGTVTQDQLEEYSTGVESTKTLKNFLRAMHIKSTI